MKTFCKKSLSILLSVLMLFSVLAMAVSASTTGAIITVKKTDEIGNALKDAEFTLTNNTPGFAPIVLASGNDGYVTFGGLDDGEYTLEETKAPDKYIADGKMYHFKIEGGRVLIMDDAAGPQLLNGPLVVVNKQDTTTVALPNIEVKKVDENNNPLAGAVFALYGRNNNVVATTESGTDGMVTFAGVNDGLYTVKETAAPEGYILSMEEYVFEVREGKVQIVENGDPIDYDDIVKFVNKKEHTPILPNIEVKKVDENGNALAGATFALVETTPGANEPKTYTAISDEKGVATFKEVADGEYIVKETQAPAGYNKSDKELEVIVEDGDPVHDELIFVNTKIPAPILPNIEVKKVDENGNALAGATFVLVDRAGAVKYTAVSNANGIASFKEVADGIYTIKESKAPEGYHSSNAEYQVVVENGDPLNYEPVTFVNVKIPVVDDSHGFVYDDEDEGIEIVVRKKWAGDNTIVRPEEVKVQLLKNGKPFGKAVTLKANSSNAKDWKYTWTGLDEKAEYSVVEVDTPEGYSSTVEHIRANYWVITNTYNKVESKPNPSTGADNMISSSVALAVISLCAAAVLMQKK